MWILTYVGALFNGLTLLILGEETCVDVKPPIMLRGCDWCSAVKWPVYLKLLCGGCYCGSPCWRFQEYRKQHIDCLILLHTMTNINYCNFIITRSSKLLTSAHILFFLVFSRSGWSVQLPDHLRETPGRNIGSKEVLRDRRSADMFCFKEHPFCCSVRL